MFYDDEYDEDDDIITVDGDDDEENEDEEEEDGLEELNVDENGHVIPAHRHRRKRSRDDEYEPDFEDQYPEAYGYNGEG